jgi:hypothetical protein
MTAEARRDTRRVEALSGPDAARAGAAQALAEVLGARRPEFAVEVTFGELDRNRRARRNASGGEVGRLEASSDHPNALGEIAPPPAHPDDAESAA